MGTEMLQSRAMECELTIDVESLDVGPEMTSSLLNRYPDDDGSSTRSLSPSSRCLSPGSKEHLRLRVNSRERERMHDINSAMDALRQVMPYAQGPSVKKISKMNSLLLARNYIVLLKRSIEDMKRLLAEVCMTGPPLPPMTSQAGMYHTTGNTKGGHRSITSYPAPDKMAALLSSNLTLAKATEFGASPPMFPAVPYLPVTLGVSSSQIAAHQHVVSHLPCPCAHCVAAKIPTSFPGLHPHLIAPGKSVTSLHELNKA